MKKTLKNWFIETSFKVIKTFLQTAGGALVIVGGLTVKNLQDAALLGLAASITCFLMYLGCLDIRTEDGKLKVVVKDTEEEE